MDFDNDLDDSPMFTRYSFQKTNREESTTKCKQSYPRPDKPHPVTLKPVQNVMKVKYGLPFLQTTLFATILEDVLTQINILGEINTELHIYKTNKELNVLRAAKFGVEPPKIDEELTMIDTKDLKSEHHKLNKLVNDRNFCEDILTATYLELALRNTYGPLVKAINDVYEREKRYIIHVEEEARNRSIRRELSKQLRQQRNRFRSQIYDTNLTIEKLKNDVEDVTLNKEVRTRYIEQWEKAREEQNMFRNEGAELGPSKNIGLYRKKSDGEQRVHYELDLHANILINDVLRKLDYWVDKYDEDAANMDLKIEIKKVDAAIQKEKREELEKKLASQELEMNKWKQFKEDREKLRQYKEKMMNAALVVQAWWRGLLVRQQLGPYKPARTARKPKSEKKK